MPTPPPSPPPAPVPPDRRAWLALDASTETVHLALVQGPRVTARAMPGSAQASAALLPAVQAMLQEAGMALRDLDAIGYGRGPGAFTGLRTACSVAQGLAFGAERPVLALDTLAALAEAARQAGEADTAVWGVLDARMGELYAARWRRDAATGAWQADVAPALWSPAALAEAVEAAPAPLAGPGVAAQEAVLGPLAGRLGLRGWPEAAPHGAALAALVRAAADTGPRLDPAQALPLYLRDKVAQTTAEREAARRGAGA